MAELGDELELRDIDVALSDVPWKNVMQLAIRLGVPKYTLDDIETENPTNANGRKLAAMNCWLKRDVSVSWEKLAEELNGLGLTAQAQKIQEKYCGKPAPAPCSTPGMQT